MHFFRHGDWFYNRYTNSTIRTKYLDDNGTGVKPKYIFLIINRKNCQFDYNSRGKIWYND